MCLKFVKRVVFVLSVAVFAALGLGFGLGEFGLFGVHAGGDQDGAYRQMRVYAEVLKKIQTDYVTEPNVTDVTTGALHGLLESLDSDSSYLTADRVQDLQGSPHHRRGPGGHQRLQAVWLCDRGQRNARLACRPGTHHRRRRHRVHRRQSTRELSLAVIRLMLDGKPGTQVTSPWCARARPIRTS
jgi:carboxyl-terminal processing protease